jgi:prophage tail gpP-like protein
MIAPDSEELTIRAGGRVLGGWQEFEVSRSAEQLPTALRGQNWS